VRWNSSSPSSSTDAPIRSQRVAVVVTNVGGDGREHRRHERVRMAGTARVVFESSSGPTGTYGQIVDLSEGGCAVRLHRQLAVGDRGRVQLQTRAATVWLSIVVCSVTENDGRWIVGIRFDQPTDEKLELVRRLMQQRRRA
jgi:hypothetical protein